MTMQKHAKRIPLGRALSRFRHRRCAHPCAGVVSEMIASNIEQTLKLLGGDADRWRVHIKTAKLGFTLRMLVERGVRNFKCATTLELLVACRSGAADVLFAYPAMGANARRVREIAQQFPEVRISVLAENDEQVRQWRGSRVGVFLDINPGMNRTGIEQSETEKLSAWCARCSRCQASSSAGCTTMTANTAEWRRLNGLRRRTPAMIACWKL